MNYHHELVTAIEPDNVTVAIVAVDTLLERVFVEERHDLSEDCFPLFMACGWPLDGYRKVTEVLIEKFSEPCKLLKLNS